MSKSHILSILLLAIPWLLNAEPLYHGTQIDNIEHLEPRLRYTPGKESSSPPGIYASDLPAFAAAHSFPWSSDEGIDLYVAESTVVMEIPRSLLPRLQAKIYIYTVDSHPFSRVEQESTGHTFRATVPVDCLEKIGFENVVDALWRPSGCQGEMMMATKLKLYSTSVKRKEFGKEAPSI